MTLPISKRLKALISFIGPNEVTADIGSDHAKLPIALYERGVTSRLYAVENKKGPYLHMKEAIETSSFPIVPIFGDGFKGLPSEVETAVLAGLGERLIAGIIEEGNLDDRPNLKALVLDAHGESAYLRSYLTSKKWHLTRNLPFFDEGIYYDVERWERGAPPSPYGRIDLAYGPMNVRNPSPAFLDMIGKRLKEVMNLLDNPAIEGERRSELIGELSALEGIIDENR